MQCKALLQGCKVENGQIVTAAGTAYKALVIPVDKHLSEALKAHLETLKAEGGTTTEIKGAMVKIN